jgi:phage gpG-like protein
MIEAKLTVNKKSSERVQKKLAQVRDAVSTNRGGGAGAGMGRVNYKVSVWLDRWVQRNFRSEGGKVGGWLELAEATIARRTKGRGKGSAKILQDTGRLRASFSPFHTRRSAGIGSDIKYAKIHEIIGVKRKDKPKPVIRRMLPE